nr:zinc finger, CCHC-type [Tanacetum cinerariifolium]
MTDSRPVLEQYNELLGILERFTQHKIDMDESIHVSCIIYKLSLSWKDFKHTLKHLKEELTLVELGSHLRIEESLKAQDNDKTKGNSVDGHSVVNMVKHNNSSRYNDNRGKRKLHDTKADPNKKPKVTCWKYGKPGHLKKDCKAGNVGNKANGSSTKGFSGWFIQLPKGATVLNIVFDNISSAFMSTSKLNNSILWHARLGHVHFKRMQDMFKGGLISAFDMDTEKSLDKFKVFKTKVELQQGSLIKRFRTDSGGTRDLISDQHSYCFNIEDDLKMFDEAMKSQNVAFWKKAINDKMDSIIGNNTWVLVDLPPCCKPLGCKWIFKIKLKLDGTVEKFKVRLVIHGFKQKSGIDYFDTYAPVACISTIRLLIAMTSIHNLIIHQIDVKTTFLNGKLEEEVYMNQLQGFIMPSNENKVCKMINPLYGLKQTPKEWHQKFDEVVLSNGYLLNQANKCVYSKFDEFGILSLSFSMKDLGDADVIMGIKIKHESNGMAISQSHYIKKVLKKFNYFDCTLVGTLIDTSEKLMLNNGQAVSQLEYSRVINCLMYAMTCIRPDIEFVVGKLSRYTCNPGIKHRQAIQIVLKYLKKTMDYRLMYTGDPSMLEGYTDASWINNTEDNSSTSGWAFLLGGGVISWASKKQTCSTGSTMESEFVALAAAGKEAEWLKNLLLEIPLWVKPIEPISIRCDSAATLAKTL